MGFDFSGAQTLTFWAKYKKPIQKVTERVFQKPKTQRPRKQGYWQKNINLPSKQVRRVCLIKLFLTVSQKRLYKVGIIWTTLIKP